MEPPLPPKSARKDDRSSPAPAGGGAKSARVARSAAALRENLRRRKVKTRALAGVTRPDTPGG